MRPWPNAQFWRLWLTAGALCLAGCTALVGIGSAHAETGRASYYGSESGSRTASGARFRPMGLSAAHRTLPLGTRLRVRWRGRSVDVVVNDRGPAAWTGRVLDLSRGAARALGFERAGVATVQFERLN